MKALILHFWLICTFRAGPADTPHSRPLLWLALAANLVTAIPLGLDLEVVQSAALAGLELLLLAGLLWGVLMLRGRGHRFVQAYTAFMGCGVLLNLLALPVALAWQASQAIGGLALFDLLGVVLLVWSLLVTGQIFHQALDWPFVAGLAAAMGYYLLSILLYASLFPQAVNP
jgi:hypothetical protein